MSERKFAFGEGRRSGHNCPIYEVGMEKQPFYGRVANEFDRRVNKYHFEYGVPAASGVVREQVAKEIWQEVIEALEEDFGSEGITSEPIELARKVAEELGWSYDSK